MLKILKKDSNFYELKDDDVVLGTLEYTSSSSFLKGYLDDATIKIGDRVYNITHTISTAFILPRNHFVQLSDSSSQKISNFDFYQGRRFNTFKLEKVSIILSGVKYNLKTRSRIASLFSSMSSAYGWYDSEEKECLYMTTTKGFPSTTEVVIETKLNKRDIDTALLSLWGFYLLPKTRDSVGAILVLFILCPFLVYLLYIVFLPYF